MSNENVKGTVEWDGRRITVEGPPSFVSAELDRFRGFRGVGPDVNGSDSVTDHRPETEASLIARKRPQDHYERIAVLAARLKESGKVQFDSDDMRKAYLRAGIKPPKVMQQALIDTKNKKGYIEPTESRGCYELTDFGSDFVQFELPRKEVRNS